MRQLSVRLLRGCLTAVLALAVAVPATAQQAGRLQGTIVDRETQQPLSGAQVSVEGHGIGTLTNVEGRYLLMNVPAGSHTIRVTLLGYEGQTQQVTVPAGGSATADFSLGETAIALEEIVVTGTAAATRRREVGTSIEAVSARELELAPIANPQQALAGRAAGVTVMTNSGQPGSGGTIKIRGINTISQDAEPLIYVDGVRVFNEGVRIGYEARTGVHPLQDIAAEDIERIEVVKGAAATTLYGTEAAAGVIQIFTKRGFAGEPVWSAEIGGGWNSANRFGPEGDPTDLYTKCSGIMRGLSTSSSTRGQEVTWVDPTCPEDGDWKENGAIQTFNLSVRGGAENARYYLSGNYSNNGGILPTQGSKDGGFRGNFGFNPFDELSVDLNTAYQRRDTRWAPDGNNAQGFLLNVGRGYRGNFQGGTGDDCEGIPDVDHCMSNGYLFDMDLTTESDRFTSGLTLNYAPWENFTNRLAVGWDYINIHSEDLAPFGMLNTEEGTLGDEIFRHSKLSLDYAGSFQNRFGADFASTLSWGGQLFRDWQRFLRVDVEGFAGPGRPTTETGATLDDIDDRPLAKTSAGLFLQEMIGWQDRLFVTGGLRVDGNSAFGDDFGLQAYPKLSLSYVLSDYDFWPAIVETFKLRAAVGESGKAPGPFDKFRTWSPISGDDSEPGFTPNDIGNNEVGPERTREIELGFDASAFEGRLGAEITYYNQKTFDALVPVTYPPSEGFLSSRIENVGELANTGFEANLRLSVIRTPTLEWRLRTNMSFMDSEAMDLNCVADEATGDESCAEIYTGLKSYIRKGFPIPTYFGEQVLNPDAIADPEVSDSLVAIGPAYPDQVVGFGTTVTAFQRLTLDVLAEYQGGHYLPNYTGYQNARRGVWEPCFEIQQAMYQGGDLSNVTALERAKCAMTGANSDFWVEAADFVKLRNISLTWAMPQQIAGRIGLSNASLTLAATNLYTWSDYSGGDPEVQDVSDQFNEVGSAGSFGRRDYYQIPPPKTFMITLRTTF